MPNAFGKDAGLFLSCFALLYFCRPFNPRAAGGNVERWLIECEAAMRDSLKDVLRRSFDAYAHTQRIRWVSEWPGQVVLCVGSMYWTHNTGQAIVRNTLPKYSNKLTEELLEVRDAFTWY